jgi:hypothetical protein
MHSLQSEIERLYESESLTDELHDTEAKILLSWAEGQVKALAFREGGEFEEDCRRLRQFVKYLNRFVGQRRFMDEAQQRDALDNVQKWAERLGWTLTIDGMMSSLNPQPDMTIDLKAILALLPAGVQAPYLEKPPSTGNMTENPSEGPSLDA